MSLERVIADQQTEIDMLRVTVARLSKEAESRRKHDEEFFRVVSSLMSPNSLRTLRECWRDDKKEEWMAYTKKLKSIETDIKDFGFCIDCQSFLCSCDDFD